MVEEIRAYRAGDGTMFADRAEAQRHDFINEISFALIGDINDPTEVAKIVYKRRWLIYQAMAEVIGPEAEEAGK